MIDYDSFSRCHLTDIFFCFSRGSKRVKMVFLKLEMKYAERREAEGIMVIGGDKGSNTTKESCTGSEVLKSIGVKQG